ncbi:FadR/GntR family transcriptional regulator [Nocardia sp. CA-135953]|uniref:FadR/GntR family transcriptional regulator n=1 Tax=Nocardia sp. CA-135953 TaxID=3239978 RepID=UPI003D98BD4C
MSRPETLAAMLSPEAAGKGVRTPKTAEVLAGRLRRMIVDGQLKEGDFLPHEAELMTHFQVSRPTLREAVRVLESERLVEVRRGSRTGARVRVPGPEIVARPAGLLLELSGATLADVMAARAAIEPAAVGILAATGSEHAHDELENMVEAFPDRWESGDLARATAVFHLQLVELSGNSALAMIAGMLHEISERHTAAVLAEDQNIVPKKEYARLLRSYRRLLELVRDRNSAEAEAHWRRHMAYAGAAILRGNEKTKVRDIMG